MVLISPAPLNSRVATCATQTKSLLHNICGLHLRKWSDNSIRHMSYFGLFYSYVFILPPWALYVKLRQRLSTMFLHTIKQNKFTFHQQVWDFFIHVFWMLFWSFEPNGVLEIRLMKCTLFYFSRKSVSRFFWRVKAICNILVWSQYINNV